MTLNEKIVYLIYEKLHFWFNKNGQVYTGDLIKKRKEQKNG